MTVESFVVLERPSTLWAFYRLDWTVTGEEEGEGGGGSGEGRRGGTEGRDGGKGGSEGGEGRRGEGRGGKEGMSIGRALYNFHSLCLDMYSVVVGHYTGIHHSTSVCIMADSYTQCCEI